MSYKKISAMHPLTKARWIWPCGNLYLHNHFARFRHDFDVKNVPGRAPLFITADKSYRLYINGQYVCRGPARGYQEHWPFDEVDVASFLRPGHNWLAAEAYNPGISTFQYLHKNKAGFICAAEWPGVSIRTTEANGSWNIGRSPGHAVDTAMLTKQMDFQEDFDAGTDDLAWIFAPEFNESLMPALSWPCTPSGSPFGQPPYLMVEPRGIPMLRENILVPEKFQTYVESACSEGYRDCKNITWHFSEEELPQIRQWNSAASLKTRRTQSSLEVEIPPAGTDRFSALTFDLGQNMPGTLIVEVEGSSGAEILDFHYHQYLADGVPDFPAPSGALIAISSRLRPAVKHCRHEFYHIAGIRHVTMVVRNAVRPLAVKLSWRMSVYPFSMTGAFSCSDGVLNRIHDICRHTQQVCALDAYVDTPWREQAQWWGDARVQIRNTIYLDGDMHLAARGIRSIAGQPAPHGLTYAHAPTCNGGCILPDFSLTWILTIWDYYWQTGDLKPFRENHNRIKKIFRYFEDQSLRTSDGLLRYDPRFWLFEDWCDIPKEPIPCFLNLWHLYTLEHYAGLLQATGKNDEAKITTALIKERRRLLVEKFFNPASGLFEACMDNFGQFIGEPSVHDQTLALLLDLKPDYTSSMLNQRLLPYIRGEKLSCAVPSIFWSTYVIECLWLRGYGNDAIDFIRRNWSPMIASGTTWEFFNYTEIYGASCNHGWSAHPAYHFVNILTGVRQLDAAWKTVELTPCFVEGITQAEASVPTPKGKLAVLWQRQHQKLVLTVDIPADMTVLLKLPNCKTHNWSCGTHQLIIPGLR